LSVEVEHDIVLFPSRHKMEKLN